MAKDIEEAEARLRATIPWDVACDASDAMILAGEILYVGGAGRVAAFDTKTGKSLWGAAVEGSAKGLAAAAGRLLVSTDTGRIYCFGPPASPLPLDGRGAGGEGGLNRISGRHIPSPHAPLPKREWGEYSAIAAQAILAQTGIRRGYCLVLGCKTGQLAVELAKRSDLMIYAVSPDAASMAAARKAIDAAGLYGARVCVDHWPDDGLPYADYFANLIVSEATMLDGTPPTIGPEEVIRMLKPLGGVAVLQQPPGADAANLKRWFEQSKAPGVKIVRNEPSRLVIERGPLAGAGSWTHEYGDCGNTACGDDELVRGPLGVLWFGDPGPGQMVNRHERAASPLSIDGRMFIQGENVLMAYDAYNGLKLWQREVPGAMRTDAAYDGSNLALSHQRLLVAVKDHCLAIDPVTGETKMTYELPPGAPDRRRRWGYVAWGDKTLLGSQGVRFTVSQRVFALDADSGKPRWVYEGKEIPHNTIAMSDGRVFLVDVGLSDDERREVIAEWPEYRTMAGVRLVVGLDARTGRTLWRRPIDLPGNLAIMAARGRLVIFGVYSDGHFWQKFFAGDFASRRVAVLDAEDGKLLWSKPVGYRVRPIVIGDTLHAEPWAFDLATGEERTRTHPVTGQTDRWQFARPGHHCGCPNAAQHCLFFRSMCLGYYDLAADYGTMHFGAQRPGCWINFIPAAGLLLVPEASVGCMCPFPNMCTVVFKPAAKQKGWGYFSAPGPMTPVERLGINLGAAGDRRDSAGKLWLGYPRPTGSLVLQFKLETTFTAGGSYVSRSAAYTPISGTDEPWLFASAARGLTRCAIPVLGPNDGLSTYRVRLGFADPDNDRPGARVFDVKLQGKTVLEGFDILAATGGRDKAVVCEFPGIEVADKLVIDLVPKARKPAPNQAPILQSVEIVRQQVLKLGCAVPAFLLSTMEPKQSAPIEIANLREAGFEGTGEVLAPEGFQAIPRQTPIKLAPGTRTKVPLEVSVGADVRAGKYPLRFRLVRSDGTVEIERAGTIEHLGPRARLVVKACEDAFVQKRYPERNKGSATALLVDGGDRTMGDLDHSIAYLKFRFAIEGRVLSVRFRIQNAGNPSFDAGRICLVSDPWKERKITYANRPACGAELAQLGNVSEGQLVERALKVDLQGKTELSLAIDPTSLDGVDFLSRESGTPPELVIDYEPNR